MTLFATGLVMVVISTIVLVFIENWGRFANLLHFATRGSAGGFSANDFFGRCVVGAPKVDDPLYDVRKQEIFDALEANGEGYVYAFNRFQRAEDLTFNAFGNMEIVVEKPSSIFRGSSVVGSSQGGKNLNEGDFVVSYPIDGNKIAKAIDAIDDAVSLFRDAGYIELNVEGVEYRLSADSISVSDPRVGDGQWFGIAVGQFFESKMPDIDGDELLNGFAASSNAAPACCEIKRKVRTFNGILVEDGQIIVQPIIHYPNESAREGIDHPLDDLCGVIVKVKRKFATTKPLLKAA